LFWGIAADAIGRKKCLLLSSLGVLIFGLASAAAPEYYTLLLFRCMAGFALGGAAQA
jgi:predicted MFS family arabinose efflux permease